MRKIELMVFDMAGTTINEKNLVYKTVCNSINDAGFKVSLNDVLVHGAGKDKLQAIIDILNEIVGVKDDLETISLKIFIHFKKTLTTVYENCKIVTYDGIEELFELLKKRGVKVVLNTGYDKKTAILLLKKLNWKVGETIDGLVTADDVKNGRPSAEMIYEAMRICAIEDSMKVLKAGDSVIDIEEGKNANCGITVGVLSGAHTEKQLKAAEPTFIVNSLGALLEML